MADDKAECNANVTEQQSPGCSSKNFNVPPYVPINLRRLFLQKMVRKLPVVVQTRIIALKNIQLKVLELQGDYWEEVYQLEKRYREKFEPLMQKRKEIVTGQFDPPKEEPKWPEAKDEKKELENLRECKPIIFQKIPEDTKGVPNFWLTILSNCGRFKEMVWDYDEPALKTLLDIKVNYANDGSFTLEFLFDKNDYFTDSVLTKKYFVKSRLDEQDPFNFDGPEIYGCEGCSINWKENMNLTVDHALSFFNFFYPPKIPYNVFLIDSHTKDILQSDYQIGNWLREVVIPKAVLFYSGDLVPDEIDDDGSESSDGEAKENFSTVEKNLGNASPNSCQTHNAKHQTTEF